MLAVRPFFFLIFAFEWRRFGGEAVAERRQGERFYSAETDLQKEAAGHMRL